MGDMSGGRLAAGTIVSLGLVFALAACESDIDVQRKAALAQQMIDDSVATCVIQEDVTDAKPYVERLRDVLMETRSADLDYLIDHGITVCLDKRLQNQVDVFWGDEAEGIYYPDVKVISLWDNRMDEATRGMFEYSAATRGDKFLEHFEDTFGGWTDKYDSLDDVHTPLFAHHYTTSAGKSTTTHYRWHDEHQRSMGSVFENQPHLRVPPIVSALTP